MSNDNADADVYCNSGINDAIEKWGIYGTWLKDGSEIMFRKKGENNYTKAIVTDDRIYYPSHSCVYENEVYHVTATSKGCIDFGVIKENNTLKVSSNREYEISIINNK